MFDDVWLRVYRLIENKVRLRLKYGTDWRGNRLAIFYDWPKRRTYKNVSDSSRKRLHKCLFPRGDKNK